MTGESGLTSIAHKRSKSVSGAIEDQPLGRSEERAAGDRVDAQGVAGEVRVVVTITPDRVRGQ